jgi:GxxExxY protein
MSQGEYSNRVVGLASDVHRMYGPGMLKSAYEDILCIEWTEAGIPFARQVSITTMHKRHPIPNTYRVDIVVGQDPIVEPEAVDKIAHTHGAQMVTDLRLSGLRVGLLFAFNVVRIKDGMKRFVNTHATPPRSDRHPPSHYTRGN